MTQWIEYQDARHTYYRALEKYPHLRERPDLHPERWVLNNVAKHKFANWGKASYVIEDREILINEHTARLYKETLEREGSK